MSLNDFDLKMNILVIGNSYVGKTSIIQRYIHNYFSPNPKSTISIDYSLKYVTINNKFIKVLIRDMDGEDKFRSIIASSYYGINGIILTFDVCDKLSFLNIKNWINEIHTNKTTNVSIILVGNKSDKQNRCISYDSANSFAQDMNLPYIEVSAKRGDNINNCFNILYDSILKKPVNIIHQPDIINTKKTSKRLKFKVSSFVNKFVN